jgi:hypothetical protein
MVAAVGAGHLLGNWKNWFTGVFALFNSSRNALSTEDLIFIWFLANAATKFHISVIQWARKCYIAQKHYIMALFLKILITA